MEGADRWGNPHVSSLSFHSLINLRLVLEKCKTLKILKLQLVEEERKREIGREGTRK
jgi:hypothetical protein